MFISSISNRKLHCCLVILILFILIFLSLPLLLIYLANNRYEEWQNQRSQLITTNSNRPTNTTISSTLNTNNTSSAPITPSIINSDAQNSIGSINHQSSANINCTLYAHHANLSLADENGEHYIPAVRWPQNHMPWHMAYPATARLSHTAEALVAPCPLLPPPITGSRNYEPQLWGRLASQRQRCHRSMPFVSIIGTYQRPLGASI